SLVASPHRDRPRAARAGIPLLDGRPGRAVLALAQGRRPGPGDQLAGILTGRGGSRVAAQQRRPVGAEEGERGAEMGATELRHAPSLRGAGRSAGYGGRVHRNCYSLAALAAAAVPGLVPARTTPIATPAEDLDVAGIVGEDGRRVMVLSPGSTAAGVRLERDLKVADALTGTSLRTVVPPVLGFVTLAHG